MPAQTPEQVEILLCEAISAGNIDAAVAMYEPNATFATGIGESVTGQDAIREVMVGFTALNPNVTIDVRLVLECGDIALLHAKWHLTGTGTDGSALDMEGNGIAVVRHQADGTWKFIIDNPNGSP